MNRKTWITLGIIVGVIIVIILYSSSDADAERPIETNVSKGQFDVRVTVTGELQAKNSVKIEAPQKELRDIRIWEISIATLIPEGTVVDSGDVVATLEQTEVENELRDIEEEIEKEQGDIEKARIDSSLELRAQRDKIINLKYAMEEAEITLEQSKYESPAVIRQAQISLDKAQREYNQAVQSYELKVEQSKVTIRQRSIQLNKRIRRKEEILAAKQKLTIRAPKSGMVIYRKERDGTKKKEGSRIQLWRDPVVATLPDLSELISKTYVNEIDISKVKEDQHVDIGVDAFPELSFTGKVLQVANIGEQLPKADARVFEVTIILNETDPKLRPSMTTSNSIVTNSFENVLYVPLEAVYSNDSLTYVYKKNNVKRLVLLGEENENEVIIEKGLKEGERVYLSKPENGENYDYDNMELAEEIKNRLTKETDNTALETAMQQKDEKKTKKAVKQTGSPKSLQNQKAEK
jgi:HlyD family secretion protein